MTKLELNIILKLIDKNTSKKSYGCGQYETKEMSAEDIETLKKDIQDLFENKKESDGE